MSESNDVKALEKISTEVDEIQFNILLSTQCIKVQSFLVEKLKKQSDRQKEVCSFISSANLKLKTEIQLAELEFNNLTSALQTIKSANVEYRKELLLLKQRRSEIEERVNNGIKKYENLWMESKKKYESIPLIKQYLEVKNKCQTIQESISILKSEYEKLFQYKSNKILEIKEHEKQLILQLVDYLTNQRPKTIRIILEQEHVKEELKNEIQSLVQECPNNKSLTNINIAPTNETHAVGLKSNIWLNTEINEENEGVLLPQIQLQNSDLDILSLKLNEMKKINSITTMTLPKICVNNKQNIIDQKHKTDELPLSENYVSEYFRIGVMVDIEAADNKEEIHRSDRKLIHILDDIKLDKKQMCNVVGQINYNTLQSIDVIKAANEKEKNFMVISQKNPAIVNDVNNSENNEEIELSNKNTSSVVLPPTQFMDLTQDNHFEISNQSTSGHRHDNKLSHGNKKVQFDIKESQDKKQTSDNFEINTSSESLNKMKEMILKKKNLDLSPQFVYTKNTHYLKGKGCSPTQDNITSKFFDNMDMNKDENPKTNNTDSISVGKDNIDSGKVSFVEILNSDKNAESQETTMFKNCSSPKDDQDMTVAGLLFNHGPQSIPDSLNLSMSTAEYEEGDSDFVHGIDSSLLLSPKPEIQTNEENKNEAGSEGMNNFLSGLKKTGLSLFGDKLDDSKANSNQKNNFTFSFGGDDKRSRGGLFSMFH